MLVKNHAMQRVLLGGIFLIGGVFALAQAEQRGDTLTQASMPDQKGAVELSALTLEKQRLEATIRSEEDLQLYLRISERIDTPFGYLSEAGRQVFVDSLMFTDHGLASFRHDVLYEELTPEQHIELLDLFGFPHPARWRSKDSSGNPTIQSGCDGGGQQGGAIGLCDEEGYFCIFGDCVQSEGWSCNPSTCN